MSKTTLPETSKVGKRGVVVIPAKLRKKFGIQEGSIVITEERPEGILIRPAIAMPVEIYSQEKIAEFLLSNAVGSDEYARAREQVKSMGLDPDIIPHVKPEE